MAHVLSREPDFSAASGESFATGFVEALRISGKKI
jgi:hypothetical protein